MAADSNREEQETDEQNLKDQASRELLQIELALTNVTGQRLKSNWNRTVELTDDINIRGEKPFTCTIRISRSRMHQGVRWRTLIHEMLHAHSAGYNRLSFEALPGWEEGVVERLQRLLRSSLLTAMGVSADDALFLDEEQAHPYNRYIVALESMRQLLGDTGEDAADFYISLLNVPIKDRLVWMMQRGKQLPEDQKPNFLRTFALSNIVLRQSPRVLG